MKPGKVLIFVGQADGVPQNSWYCVSEKASSAEGSAVAFCRTAKRAVEWKVSLAPPGSAADLELSPVNRTVLRGGQNLCSGASALLLESLSRSRGHRESRD
jgi:hypothetical protein